MQYRVKYSYLGVLLIVAVPAHAATVDGFRSAKFGADEKAVIQAAMHDLQVGSKDIQKQQDPATKVTVLSARLKSFAPFDMPATVNYVMGYKCNCLTQVSVQWDYPKEISPAQRGAALMSVGALVSKFQNEGWGKDEVILNRVPGNPDADGNGAVVFFRGQNAQGSAVTVVGAPVKIAPNKDKPGDSTADVDSMKVVSLIYERDSKNPDVDRIDVTGF